MLYNYKKFNPWYKQPFLCIDIETTGLNHKTDKIIEIAWILFYRKKIIFKKKYLCKIKQKIPKIITKITKITNTMLINKKHIKFHLNEFLQDLNKVNFIVAYNIKFDMKFITHVMKKYNKYLPSKLWIDPYIFIKKIDYYQKGKKLTDATTRRGIYINNAHRAESDAIATGNLLYALQPQINYIKLADLYKYQIQLDNKQMSYIKISNYQK